MKYNNMAQKQKYKMAQQVMDDIIAINKNQSPVMKFGDYWSGMDLQEKINHYWETLGKKYGFEPLSVEPHPTETSDLFFIATPCEKKRTIEIEKYFSETTQSYLYNIIVDGNKHCSSPFHTQADAEKTALSIIENIKNPPQPEIVKTFEI